MSSPQLFSVAGKTVVITGASSGCGVVFATALAGAGANVVIGARRLVKLEGTARAILSAGGVAVARKCDVTSSAEVEALLDLACERFGRVDVMINNAGAHAGGGMMPERLSDAAAAENVNVNLLGAWYGCKHAGVRMLRDGRGGSIINIGSTSGCAGWTDQAPLYGASKAGIVNFTQTLAASWGDRGVRVNVMMLGFFPSEMSQHFLAVPAGVAFALEHIPLNRVGKPEELVGPITFLASDASSYVTGATIAVDGGMASLMGHRMPEAFYELLAQQPGDVGRKIGRPPT